jgi:hypothetical protein
MALVDSGSGIKDNRSVMAARKASRIGAIRSCSIAPSGYLLWLAAQYESELMTSPPLIDPRLIHVAPLIEFLTNRTEPSATSVLTPPG